MKRNIFKKVISMIVILLILITVATCSDAASYTISSSKSEVTVGDTFTITVRCSSMAGKFTISGSSNVTITGTKTDFLDNSSMTVTVKANSVGTAKITVKAVDVADYDANVVTGSKSCSVTIKEKNVTQPPVITNPNTNNNSNTNTNKNKNTDINKNTANSKNKENADTNTKLTQEKEEAKAPFGISYIDVQGIKYNEEKEPITLDKPFDMNIYEYNCDVSAEVKTLDIQYDAKEYNEYVSIVGLEEDLKTGENIVILKLSKEGETDQTYTIKINRKEETIQANSDEMIEKESKEPIVISMPLGWFILMQIVILALEIIITKVVIDIIRNKRKIK